MLIYNQDGSVWILITQHEYAGTAKLHLHLNEKRAARWTDASGRPMTETVVLNLSIRLAQIPGTPNVGKEQYLYEKLILQPLAYLKKQPYVAVRESPVF